LVQNGGGYGQGSPTTTPINSMNINGTAQPTTTTTQYQSTVTLPTTAYVYQHSPGMSSPGAPASVVPATPSQSAAVPAAPSQSAGAAAVPGQSTPVPEAPSQSMPAPAASQSASGQTGSGQSCSSGSGSPDSTSNATSLVPGWTSAGCWSDSSSDRVLSGIEFANVGQHSVTNTKCIQYCAAKGYSVAGTEFGGQCFCGNQLASSSTELEDSECDMPCEGDSTQICGGGNALTVYKSNSVSRIKKRLNRHLARHLRQRESV
jgi:hypothetical protein